LVIAAPKDKDAAKIARIDQSMLSFACFVLQHLKIKLAAAAKIPASSREMTLSADKAIIATIIEADATVFQE